MPFTFSHAAAIIPIKEKGKRYFSLTGLVLGSMAPDFEYFFRFSPVCVIGHTYIGFLTFNLPVCFILAYIFHWIIKKPLLLHIPKPISFWFSGVAEKNWNLASFQRIITFIYSALLGMLTHVVWDSFTHSGGYMVDLLPVLSTNINIFGFPIAFYKLLQHGSSVLGMIIIVIYLYRKREDELVTNQIPKRMKVMFGALTILISILLYLAVLKSGLVDLGLKSIGNIVVTVINCMFFGLMLTSLVSRLWIGADSG